MRKHRRLRRSDVLAIRIWYADRDKFTHGGSYRRIAKQFRVSHMTIARIVRGETYKGVK